jgi:hypothetical protein
MKKSVHHRKQFNRYRRILLSLLYTYIIDSSREGIYNVQYKIACKALNCSDKAYYQCLNELVKIGFLTFDNGQYLVSNNRPDLAHYNISEWVYEKFRFGQELRSNNTYAEIEDYLRSGKRMCE